MVPTRGTSKWVAWIFLAVLALLLLFLTSSRSPEPPVSDLTALSLTGPLNGAQMREIHRQLKHLTGDAVPARLETPPEFTASSTGGRLLFAHIGDGDIPSLNRFMRTTFILVNESPYRATGTLEFYNDSGAPLTIQIGSETASSFPVKLKPGELKRLETSGTGGLKVGWAVVKTDQPIAGTSSFSVRNSKGTVFTDVGVAESMLNREFTLFADSKGEADTGVALVNPDATRTVTLQAELRNTEGGVVSTAPLSLPPLGHLARFLTELFKQVPNIEEFEGSLRITGNLPFGGVTLRAVGSLLTSVPMIPARPAGKVQTELFFPHIADGSGGGLKIASTVLLFNNTEVPVSGTVDFFKSDGSAMQVRSNGQQASSFDFSLAPYSARRLVTEGAGSIKTGWASVTADSHVAGAAVFHMFNQAGKAITEVGVSQASPVELAGIIADSTGPFRSGFALANPLDEEVTVDVRLLDLQGTQVADRSIELQPSTHQSQFLDELFSSVPGIEEMEGRVVIQATEPILVLTLRQVNTLTTSVPTLIPTRGFAPVSVLGFAQNLTKTSPPIRWQIEQRGTDLALDTIRVVCPDLVPLFDQVKPGDVIGYGMFLFSVGGAEQGGIAKLIVTGMNSIEFDVVISGPQVVPGTVIMNGKIAARSGGGLLLELGPTDAPNGDWNTNVGIALDLMIRQGIIRTPDSARQVTITTTYGSASSKLEEDAVRIIRTTRQKQAFEAPASNRPVVTSQQPVLFSSGRQVVLHGGQWGSDPEVLFSANAGPVTAPVLEVSSDALTVAVPPTARSGPLHVRNGNNESNALEVRSLFSPVFTASKSGTGNFTINLTADLPDRQLQLYELRLSLFEATWNSNGLGNGSQVGTMTALRDGSSVLSDTFDVTVASIASERIDLIVTRSGSDTAIWTIILEKAEIDGGTTSTLTVKRGEPSEIPFVNGLAWNMELDLPGISFQASDTVFWSVQATSGASDILGSETGLPATSLIQPLN